MGKLTTGCGSTSENAKLKLLEDKLRRDLAPKNIPELPVNEGVLNEASRFYVHSDGELKQLSLDELKVSLALAGASNNITISKDGYWVIDGEVSTVKAQGPKGDIGQTGATGTTGARGEKGDTGNGIANIELIDEYNIDGNSVPLFRRYRITFTDPEAAPFEFEVTNGIDGATPYIGDTGNWFIGDIDTGVKAVGRDGRGIKNIEHLYQDGEDPLVDFYRINFTDGTDPFEFIVHNGVQGKQGEVGPVGPQGETGPVGPQGPKGDKGDVGPQGPAGIQGPQGVQGLTGQTGKDGRDGKDGKNADLTISDDGKWVINGITTGTDAQGPQGEQGIQGIQGPKGDTGLTGKDGRGIISLKQIPDTTDKSDIYEFEYTDKTKDRFIVHHGRDGEAPEISKDETWVIKGVDTGKPTRGKQGPRGDKGERGPKGDPSDTDQVIFSDTSVDGAKVLKNIHLGPVGSGEDWKVDNAGGATPEQIAQIDKNKNDIANLKTSKLDTIKLATINGQKLDEGGNITIEGSGSGATPEQIAQIDKNKKDIESLNLLTFKDNDIITKYNPIFKSYFKGKKLWVLGDSITYGVGTTEPNFYPELLAKSLGCALTKKGYSGYAYGKGKDPQYVGSSILTIMNQALAKAPGNCDILLVALGINDWTWGTNYPDNRKIGNLFDNTEFTIAGAVNIFCQKIKEIFKDYPNTEVYLSTPLPTSHTPIGGGAYTWDQSKTNFNGDTLRDICRIIIKTGAAYGFKILDMNLYFDADINNHSEMESLYADGLHLNELGNQRYALSLEKILIANPITQFTFNTLTENLNPLVKNIIYQSQKTELPDIPKITLQPQSATYKVGESPKPLLITATATNGMLSYKWFKNNQLLSESSNSLNISLPNEGQSDDYYCLVTNTLNNLISEKKSDTITITTKKKPTGIDLNKLSAKAVNLPGTSGDMLSYNKETHDVTTNKFGWNYSSYIDAPLHVGDEIELTNINFDNGGTTGNLLGLITTEEITNPKAIAGSLWAGNENFGLYIPGAAVNAPNKWDKSKQNFVKGELNGNLKGTVIIKIKQEGIEFYDNGRKVKLPNTGAVISSDKTYYLYGHHNGSAGARAYTISYMGEIR